MVLTVPTNIESFVRSQTLISYHLSIVSPIVVSTYTNNIAHNNMDEFQTVSLKKISAGSLFKIHLLGLMCSLVPLGIFNGILGAIGITLIAVRWNGEVMHGFGVLIISPLFFALLALVLTGIMGCLSWLGLWIYGQCRSLELRVVYDNQNSQDK